MLKFQLSVLLLLLAYRYEGVRSSQAEKRLVKHLFHENNHDKLVRPVLNSSDSLNVTITLALAQLIELNEKYQEIELSVWLTTEWTDYQMKWNPQDYDGIKRINVPPSTLWVPDIVLYNNVNGDNADYGGNMDTLKTRVRVYHTGYIFWIAPLIIKGSCNIQVADFPFDVQKCFLQMASWTYDQSGINLLPGGIDVSPYMPNNGWNLLHHEASLQRLTYDCCEGVYPEVMVYLHFQRKSMFYVANLIFPIGIITVLTFLTFVLPQESGERIGLSVTLMLAVTVFMLLVAEKTPDSSEGLPVVSKYFIFCMILVFIIIVYLCCISRWYNKGRKDNPMTDWTRRWIFDYLAYTFAIRPSEKQPEDCKKSKKSNNNALPMGYIHHNANTGQYAKDINGNRKDKAEDVASTLHKFDEFEEKSSTEERNCDKTSNGWTFDEEWRVVAMTIDRILFLSFLIIFVIGTIACFANSKYVV